MKITYVASKYETPEKTLEKLHAQKLPYTASGPDYFMGEHECCSEEAWQEWYVAEPACAARFFPLRDKSETRKALGALLRGLSALYLAQYATPQ